ncbi:unnamed protein product [Prorocentrum cordatum]|uniref:Mei2-like C-terminal RNA recognition motif domain-containing protein n=1 Tax=Prorocentrum cordatum TaxID=2364126 RepID=A0ABN9V0Z2_9DINO|nr:unnamed protein product [Polarella glacialis]
MADVGLQHPAGDLPVGMPPSAPPWRDEGPPLERQASLPSSSEALDPLPTTVVMQGLPRCYSRDRLVRLFNNHGFEGKCDFVFLPLDESGRENLGHAVVNLTGPLVAARFCDTFQGFNRWWHAWLKESCVVSWSPVAQGLEANIALYGACGALGGSAPDSDQHAPAVAEDGRDASLPSLGPSYVHVPDPVARASREVSVLQLPGPVPQPPPASADRAEARLAAPARAQAAARLEPREPAELEERQEPTTLMMQNVPRCYTRDMLENLIPDNREPRVRR